MNMCLRDFPLVKVKGRGPPLFLFVFFGDRSRGCGWNVGQECMRAADAARWSFGDQTLAARCNYLGSSDYVLFDQNAPWASRRFMILFIWRAPPPTSLWTPKAGRMHLAPGTMDSLHRAPGPAGNRAFCCEWEAARWTNWQVAMLAQVDAPIGLKRACF